MSENKERKNPHHVIVDNISYFFENFFIKKEDWISAKIRAFPILLSELVKTIKYQYKKFVLDVSIESIDLGTYTCLIIVVKHNRRCLSDEQENELREILKKKVDLPVNLEERKRIRTQAQLKDGYDFNNRNIRIRQKRKDTWNIEKKRVKK